MSGTVDERDDADAHAKEEQPEPTDADGEGADSTAGEDDPAERRCGISLGEQ